MVFEGDFYDYLGISHNATQEDIRCAYHKLALRYHPDLGIEKDSDAMKTLNYIHSILSNRVKKASYDNSNAYKYQKTGNQRSKDNQSEQRREQPVVEDYAEAVFVDGIEVTDSVGKNCYINLNDYIYYSTNATKKIFFYKYSAQDYYRARIEKVYSKKRNSFHKTPIFVVTIGDLEQVVFEKDFKNYWLSEAGYTYAEKRQALKTFIIGLALIGAILYILLTLE